MSTTIRVRLPDPTRRRVEVETPDGHHVVMDGDPPDGEASGAGPKETLLAALAGCTSMDVAAILAKKRQRPERYELVVSATSAAEHPRVFTEITVEHRVSGEVEAEALRRAIELSATRYCPVNAMLALGTEIEHRYRLEVPGSSAAEAVVVRIGPGAATSA
jgi:putative redox protein